MRIISFTQARNNLKSVLDGVVNDADCTVITRRDAENAVIMSMEYYDGLMETVHLLKSPANATHLAKSIEQYKMGSTTERDIINEPTISMD
jgi:antitoxin YefM